MIMMSLVFLSFLNSAQAEKISKAPVIKEPGGQSLYDVKVNSIDGVPVELSKYKGRVLLIVNTASRCGYTPQYEGLQAAYLKYQKDGLEILGFPSNDFMGQEPGTAKEIKNFCETKYKVTFPLFEKNPVSGNQKQALYQWLVSHQESDVKETGEVKWNFEKFLISKNGKVIDRFRSGTKPESSEVIRAIEGALKK